MLRNTPTKRTTNWLVATALIVFGGSVILNVNGQNGSSTQTERLNKTGPPAGYYSSAEGLKGDTLQLVLHEIIKGHTSVSYSYLWTAFQTTDDKPDGSVWDMYSDKPGGTPDYSYQFGTDQGGSAAGEGEGYNREHTFPRSWFGGAVSPMNTDLHGLVPSDIYVNNRRSNYPYGEVGTPSWTSTNSSKLGDCITPGYTGKVFEPIDEYKGDFARFHLYYAVRYLNEDQDWPGGPATDGSQPKEWSLEMLLRWHEQDTVSQKERDRNDAVYLIQKNRNPFIDHPEYAKLIWKPESDTTTSVQELQKVQNDLLVTPNPLKAGSSVSVPEPEGKYALVSINGYSWDNMNTTRLGKKLESIQPGIYFVTRSFGNRLEWSRLIVY